MELDVRIGAACPELAGVSEGSILRLVAPASFLKREDTTRIWSSEHPDGRASIVKVYCRRSRRSRFRGRLRGLRVEREYQCLDLLRRGGVPCTEPLFWGHGESAELGRFEVLGTREISGVVALRDGVRASRVTITAQLLERVFREVRSMHRVGVFHRALSWKNVLVATRPDREPQVYMVDMAKAIPFSRDLADTAMAEYDLLYLCGHLGAVTARDELAGSLAEGYGLTADRVTAFLERLDRWRRKGRLARRLRSSWFVVRSRLDRTRIPPQA